MLALANRLFQSHLDICGPEGDPGATGADRTDGEFDRALDENQGVMGRFVLGRFLPLEWIRQYEKKDEAMEMVVERVEEMKDG